MTWTCQDQLLNDGVLESGKNKNKTHRLWYLMDPALNPSSALSHSVCICEMGIIMYVHETVVVRSRSDEAKKCSAHCSANPSYATLSQLLNLWKLPSPCLQDEVYFYFYLFILAARLVGF